ncbi:MAG: DJ-1/PfpI family protein, partial [Candidatus Eremiobacteraeota bacterium]|nr:DJ-1/PfpI family protein [Candidatus Eremiobacteraeota bacterium]
MADSLKGKKVAIVVDDGFEQVELTAPRDALDRAGAQTQVVSPAQGEVKGWNQTQWGDSIKVDVALDSAQPADYDALLLPGGVMNPDKL